LNASRLKIAALFVLICAGVAVSAPNPFKEKKGFYAGGGVTYNFMTASWYDIYVNVNNAPGFILEGGFRFGGPVRFGGRLWLSNHNGQSLFFQQDRFRFYGLELAGMFVLRQKKRLRPFFTIGSASVGLRTPNKEGYKGFGYSFGLGIEYWLTPHLTLSSSAEVRYVDYTHIRLGTNEMNTGITNNGSMVSIQLLKLIWYY